MVTKDEALKMAIEDAMKFVNTLNGYEDANQSKPFKTEADKYLSYASVVIKSLATSLKEALAQPAQGITEGSQLSNLKVSSKSEKPLPPPAPIHTCTYSRTMNQEYPRKCTHCGEVEAKTQPAQEPVAFRNKTTGEFCTGGFEAKHLNQWKPLYTHPAPSWQGLSDAEILDRAAQIMVERHYKEKNHG